MHGSRHARGFLEPRSSKLSVCTCRCVKVRQSTLKANLMAKAMSMTAVVSESSTRPLRPPVGLREGVLVPPGPWLLSLQRQERY